MITVTIGKAKEIIRKLMLAEQKKPVFLHSSPGIGKSAIIRQLAIELGYKVIDLRLGSMEASDLCGIPFVVGAEQKWSIPTWFPKDPTQRVVLFLDELSNAPIAVQHAGYRLVLDREIQDGVRLHDNVLIIAAGNLKTDKTGVKGITPALANRFGVHLEIEANLDDFTSYAVRTGLSEQIVGFLNFNSSALYRFDPTKDDMAFPTPRSWESVSGLMECGFTDDELTVAISGCIGAGTANEFLSYRKYYDKLPDFTKIAKGEEQYTVPKEDIGLVFAISSSLIYHLIANCNDKKKMVNLVEVLDQLDDDFVIMCFKAIRNYGDKTVTMKVYEQSTKVFARVEKYIKIKK